MAIPSPRAQEVQARVRAIERACAEHGLTVTSTRPIDYGLQLIISDGAATRTVNVYGGKAGVRAVVNGHPSSRLHGLLSRLVAAQSDELLSTSARPSQTHGAAVFPPPPWIGSDESGKGDYFGPLVTAAVYVAPDEEAALRRAGVRDSKLLEDAAARAVAAEVRRLCAGRFAEDVLPPAEYNRRYTAYKRDRQNLNHLLADGHVRVIEALLAGDAVPQEPPPSVIADQFADERHVRLRLEEAMRRRTLRMPALVQAPRAETNVAVAAASILARDRFLCWLEEASQRYGVVLPKGGSKPEIIAAARELIRRHGEDSLGEVAKLHFATTARVLGLRDQ